MSQPGCFLLRNALVALPLFAASAMAQAGPGLPWSTCYGGIADDRIWGASLAANGDVLLCGGTNCNDFPVFGAYQSQPPGGPNGSRPARDATLVRLDPRQPGGNQRIFSTFYGGTGQESILDVTTDPTGTITVCGVTSSSDLPVSRTAFQGNNQGNLDAFVAQFVWNGQQLQLVWATYLGGSGDEEAKKVLVHPTGVVVVIGETTSADFPMTGSASTVQSVHGGGKDGFVAVLDPSLPQSQLLFSTFLGGLLDDQLDALRFLNDGELVVAGVSTSPDYPCTPNARQNVNRGMRDAVLTCMDLALTSVGYSTYLGGRDDEVLGGLDLTAEGRFVIAGSTRSTDFPTTTGSYQSVYVAAGDAFLTVLDQGAAPAAQLVWSTYLGSQATDSIHAVAVDRGGAITGFGTIRGTPGGLPVSPGAFGQLRQGNSDAFVARFDPAEAGWLQLRHATYLGGGDQEEGLAGFLDGLGNAVIAGCTDSLPLPQFPTTPGAFQGPQGGEDGFVARLSLLPDGVIRYGASTPACPWPIFQDVSGSPEFNDIGFRIYATGAPPNVLGAFLLGDCNTAGFPVLNAQILVGPAWFVSAFVWTDARGCSKAMLQVPSASGGTTFATQWIYLTDLACPGSGTLAASTGLEITLR